MVNFTICFENFKRSKQKSYRTNNINQEGVWKESRASFYISQNHLKTETNKKIAQYQKLINLGIKLLRESMWCRFKKYKIILRSRRQFKWRGKILQRSLNLKIIDLSIDLWGYTWEYRFMGQQANRKLFFKSITEFFDFSIEILVS